jgi:long-chain acyl-CoA synthetase
VGFAWGTEITRRASGLPFLMYSPRRTHVVDLLLDAAPFAERTHLVQGERRLSFADTFARIEAVAGLLHAQGVRAGDRLLLQAPNSPEWVITLWAGLRLGAIVAPGNSWWSAAEVDHAVRLLSPVLVVGDAARLAKVGRGTATLEIATLAEPGDRSAPPRPDADEDDPALIVFTAGTTGAPKGVLLAHRSVIANLHNLLVVSRRLPQQLDPARTAPVNLQSGPAFHMGGVQSLLLNLLGGATVVFLSGGRFSPGEVLEAIQRERVTVWGAVPTMASRVLEHPDVARYDLSSVRSISMGGAPVQPRLLADLRRYFPNAQRGLSTIYGMTETGGTVAAASGALMAEHPDTAGRPLPVCELRIEAPDAHGDGEIVVRTPGQLLGYWGESSTDVLDADGFVHTGDQGRLVDGLLYVTGRIKDLIIRGGENIAPAHVEAALLTHPGVRNVAVLGRPDRDLGELVAAAVQVDTPDAVSAAELAEHVAPLLAAFAVPAQWWIRTEPLPMTDAGKPDKRALAKLWPA